MYNVCHFNPHRCEMQNFFIFNGFCHRYIIWIVVYTRVDVTIQHYTCTLYILCTLICMHMHIAIPYSSQRETKNYKM